MMTKNNVEQLKENLSKNIKSVEDNISRLNGFLNNNSSHCILQIISMLENDVAFMKHNYDKWRENNEH